jgi:hypothetical protein
MDESPKQGALGRVADDKDCSRQNLHRDFAVVQNDQREAREQLPISICNRALLGITRSLALS